MLRGVSKKETLSFAWRTVFARNKSTNTEAPIVETNLVLATPEELKQKNKLAGTITVPKQVNIAPITGHPEEHVKTRRVCISRPVKNSMQSGTNNLDTWRIEFDTRERWENPLMGWVSTGDPLSNMEVEFNTKEEAIAHCEKNGYKWFLDQGDQTKPSRVKNYGSNFAWNKRTRVSTK